VIAQPAHIAICKAIRMACDKRLPYTGWAALPYIFLGYLRLPHASGKCLKNNVFTSRHAVPAISGMYFAMFYMYQNGGTEP
jgi:hypothetical protein